MKYAEEQFEELPADAAASWLRFGKWDRMYFPKLVGLEVQAVRLGYCRMLMPFKPELEQPAGIVHGGAIATLIDAVVVPAIGSAYGPEVGYSTLDMHIQYLAAMSNEGAVAEGVVLRRGRTVVFCEANVFGHATGKHLARGSLTYNVIASKSPQ